MHAIVILIFVGNVRKNDLMIWIYIIRSNNLVMFIIANLKSNFL